MKKQDSNTNPEEKQPNSDAPQYSLFPKSEDIYQRHQKEDDVDPEDIDKLNELNTVEYIDGDLVLDFDNDVLGSGLDVPGSELDDQQESVGSEDEENNYYSIGGDNHHDLEEDKGE
jgi:hypothetical protein